MRLNTKMVEGETMRSLKRILWAVAALWLGLHSGQAVAHSASGEEPQLETRIGEQGFEAAEAEIAQFDWLIGQWVGSGIGGAPAMESWLPPIGGTLIGTFVQETSKGAIMFSEHMYLMKDGASVSLKLKHFNADLTGWEEKDDMLTFRLIALEPCAAYFNALTLRCAGEGRLVAAVRMKSDTPEPQELLFYFNRLEGQKPASCPDAATTLEMNACFAEKLSQADARRKQYFAAAIAREEESIEASQDDASAQTMAPSETIAQMRASKAAFEVYRDAECGAVWETWKTGTIRGVMSLTCRIAMTDERTRTIWSNWLTYIDSTPPVLPEPQPIL